MKTHISEKRKQNIFRARTGQEFANTSDLPDGQIRSPGYHSAHFFIAGETANLGIRQ
jgi:hypothetical protein